MSSIAGRTDSIPMISPQSRMTKLPERHIESDSPKQIPWLLKELSQFEKSIRVGAMCTGVGEPVHFIDDRVILKYNINVITMKKIIDARSCLWKLN
jgi:hypothetical protein